MYLLPAIVIPWSKECHMRSAARSPGDWLIDQALAVINADAALKWRRERIRMAEDAYYRTLVEASTMHSSRRCPQCRRRPEGA